MIALFALLAVGCIGPGDPDDWLSDEYQELLPDDVMSSFPIHVRYAVLQEHGSPTFVEGYDDEQLLDLAAQWCADGASRLSLVLEDELETRGVDLNPGRDFLPPAPIGRIIAAVADEQQPELCLAVKN